MTDDKKPDKETCVRHDDIAQGILDRLRNNLRYAAPENANLFWGKAFNEIIYALREEAERVEKLWPSEEELESFLLGNNVTYKWLKEKFGIK